MVSEKQSYSSAFDDKDSDLDLNSIFFDHAGVIFVVLRPDAQIAMINRKACEVLECERDDVLGRNWFDMFIPEDERDRVREVFHLIMNDVLEPVEYFDNDVLSLNGRRRSVQWHNTIIRDQEGSVRFSLSSGIDTTESREKQRQLVESHERFRTLFERAGDGMLVADANTKQFIAANPSICQLLGYERDELLRLSVNDIHPPEILSEVITIFEQQYQGKLDVAVNIQVKRKDGSIAWVDISSTPITLDGRSCLLGIFRDITEKKNLESRLLQTQKMESLGVLAGGLAHDLNNLLSGVLGHADLARQPVTDQSALKAHLESIVGAAKQAAELCQRLLEYAGKSNPVFKSVDLNTLVDGTRSLMDVSVLGSAQLVIETAAQPIWISCVSALIQQVLVNLVTNAFESMSGKAGSVRVTTRQEVLTADSTSTWLFADSLPTGPCAILEVADQGCGMAPNVLERAFDPFFSTKAEGRGLGLSAVVGIIRQHGGALTIESQMEEGTKITIMFPIVSDVTSNHSTAIPLLKYEGKSQLILVADDNPTVGQVAKLILENIGYEVVVVTNGHSAITAYHDSKKKPSAAILDLTMPKCGGLEAAMTIWQTEPEFPVLFMSGYSDQYIDTGDLIGHPSSFIQKPFLMDDLLRNLNELISHST